MAFVALITMDTVNCGIRVQSRRSRLSYFLVFQTLFEKLSALPRRYLFCLGQQTRAHVGVGRKVDGGPRHC